MRPKSEQADEEVPRTSRSEGNSRWGREVDGTFPFGLSSTCEADGTFHRAPSTELREVDSTFQWAPVPGQTFRMGRPTGVNLDKALDLAAAMEDDETVRKTILRK